MLAQSIMDVKGLEKVAHDIATQIGTVTHQYGPGTMDLILGVERFRGLEGLLPGFVFFIFFMIVLHRVITKWEIIAETERSTSTLGPATGYTIVLLVLGFASGITLLNIWNWVALFYPQIALAHDVIDKVMK